MKKFNEFLLENELDDLRMDLMGLGFTRWEVMIWGNFNDDDWKIGFTSKGKGDSKEEAANFALSAILDVIYPTNYLPGKRLPHWEFHHEIKEIRDFKEFEEKYGIASDLVKKTLSDSLYTQDLYKDIYEEELFVEVRMYEGLESGGIIRYEPNPQ